MITILNTSILTSFGDYRYRPVEVGQVRMMLDKNEWQSAVGHESTAVILTELLGRPIPMNRMQYAQQSGEVAVVFKLKARAPEGTILSREEIEAIGYEFGTLERVGS
jgi:hypothetical protein